MSEQELATPLEDANEAVQPDESQASEATESTEGQVKTQPAEGEEAEADAQEDQAKQATTRNQRRRAEMRRLQESEAKATRDRDDAVAELDRLKAILDGQKAPVESDFADFTEYQAALAAYKSVRALDERQVSQAEEKVKAAESGVSTVASERQKEVQNNWTAQIALGKQRYTDFEAKVFTAPISDDVAQMVAALDTAADVACHLGTHPDEAVALSAMSQVEAAMEIGRIEARISAPKPKIQTSAPDPINPVRSKPTSGKDPLKMTPSEYDKWRAEGGTF